MTTNGQTVPAREAGFSYDKTNKTLIVPSKASFSNNMAAKQCQQEKQVSQIT